MKHFKKMLMMVLMLSATLQQLHAAVTLDRTRIIFDGNQKAFGLTISNKNKNLPYLAQAWIEDMNENKVQGPLVVIPPLQRLEPDQHSQIKIQALPTINQLAQDRESVYYFNLREIPPKSDKPNTLQIALQTRIKLFYRPASLMVKDDAQPWQALLRMERRGDEYWLHNPTPYFVVIVDASAAKGQQGPADFEAVMLDPFAETKLNVAVKTLGHRPVLTYVNDYGARPQLQFNCQSQQCNLEIERK